MTLLVADQDADIKAKQEYILKLEQDIKVRLAEIEAINNVRDYFNTPEFRQRVADKKKRRKFEDYDDEEEEVVEAKPETKKNPIVDMITADNRDEQMKKEENELLSKLREVNKANSEYSKDIEEINKREKAKSEQYSNPFAAFANIQNDIEKTNKELIDNQKDLANSIDDTIKAVEEDKNDKSDKKEDNKEEVKAEETKTEDAEKTDSKEEKPAKKGTNLQGLLDSAKKLKK